jgi:ribonucleoside-diphosphate reductase alpha chain
MNSGLQFFDGITTQEIQKILVKSASDLISLESPNYQFVAARLLLFGIQKQVFNTKWKDSEIYPPLGDIIQKET